MLIFVKLVIADRFSVRKSSGALHTLNGYVSPSKEKNTKKLKKAAMEEKIVAYSKLHLNFIYQEISRTDTARV